MRSAWWQKHLDARGLPGGPVQVRKDDSGEFLTRADVWGIAANADADPTHNNGNSGLGSGVAAVGLVANGLPDRPWGLLHE